MDKELFQKYAALRLEMHELETKEKVLKSLILSELNKNKTEKVITDLGSFTVCKKVAWAYTDSIKKIEDRLKIARVREQEKGLAVPNVTEYLMFKENDPS